MKRSITPRYSSSRLRATQWTPHRECNQTSSPNLKARLPRRSRRMNMAIRSLRFKVRLPRTGRRKAVTAREDLLEDTEILAAMRRDLERPPEMNADEQDLLPWGGY